MVVLSIINLSLMLKDEKHKREVYAKFAVIDIPLAYNGILGHPVLNCHSFVNNMGFLCLKLLALRGMIVV